MGWDLPERDCHQCGQPFKPGGPNAKVCSDECRKARSGKAGGADAKAKAAQRRAAGVEDPRTRNARIVRERDARQASEQIDASAKAVHVVLTGAAARLAPGPRDHDRRDNVDQQFFTRLHALREALKAGEHAASRDALIDLIASATAWAARINPGAEDGEIPGPSWPVPAKQFSGTISDVRAAPVALRPDEIERQLAPVRTHPGANAVSSYVEALAARAGDLDTEQALDRLERILGLGAA